MRLCFEKVRVSERCRVGYIPCIDKYVMAVSDEKNDLWYDSYYNISETDYESYKSNVSILDKLAAKFRRQGNGSKAFLFSDKAEYNNHAEAENFRVCRDSQKNILTGELERI